MLAAPQFDTYGILRAYAKSPSSRHTIAGMALLRMRASRALAWEVLSRALDGLDFDKGYELHIGHKSLSPTVKAQQQLFNPASGMSQEERDRIYIEMCRNSGVEMTQEMLDDIRNSKQDDKHGTTGS